MIRQYHGGDYEDVAYLNKISYERPCSGAELKEKIRHGAWVAEINGQVIGAAIVCPENDKTLLWSITVAPAQQNKGWGATLLREVARNFPELWLYVSIASDARRLYEREGFRIEKLIMDHYGPGQHAYLMRKK